jgi:hypothetical protein
MQRHGIDERAVEIENITSKITVRDNQLHEFATVRGLASLATESSITQPPLNAVRRA